MSGLRIAAALAALTLAACAQPEGPAPVAAAPEKQPEMRVTREGDVAIRVVGKAKNDDALEPLHCAAAKRARSENAEALAWVGGVAKRDKEGEGVSADLVYEIEPSSAVVPSGKPPAESRAATIEDWLGYCDAAGIPREGEA